MKYSKKWLQEYIVETLPSDEVIAEALNAKAFEVEGVEVLEGDFEDSIFDIKVLPNRMHDALGMLGMAREISACLGFTFKNDLEKEILETKNNLKSSGEKVNVEVIDEKACNRFMAVRIDGVKVGETPEYIKRALKSIDQKSINNIVDITNYVQFVLNKPMHAYDANNIEGGIIVRYAKAEEKLITLDEKELILDEKTLVIADHKKVLGLAGIKGGKFSGVNPDTTSVILESANFESVLIRKTSQKYNLKTDASKRFENGISNQLIEDALYYTAKLILENCIENNEAKKEASISEVTDIYINKNKNPYFIGVTRSEINSVLGSDYNNEEIENAFKRLGFDYKVMNTLDFIKNNADKVLGAKYKNPANVQNDAPEFFSCSSLVSYLFKGIWMPSLSIDKYVFCRKISNKDSDDNSLEDLEKNNVLKYGDLIFANTGEGKIRNESVEYMRGTKVEAGIDHVGIYVGDGKVLHATKVKGVVLTESISDFRKDRKIIGAGRVSENLEEERYIVNIPHQRLDLKIKENIIEEVGRIIGYDKLIPTLPNLKNKNGENKIGIINKELYYQNIIKNILFKNNYSEVLNYSFVEKGEVSLLKAASTKNKLRTSIGAGMIESVQKNINNMPLLHIDTVKAFEFGKVFDNEGECFSLCIACDDGKKKSNFAENVDMLMREIKSDLGLEKIEYEVKNVKPYIIEINFDEVLNNLKDNLDNILIENKYTNKNIKYKTFSQMPFIIRDIAFWIEESNELLKNKDNILEIIKENAGDLCMEVVKFDEFKKEIDGVIKTSLGYRLIYQSFEKTLTDEEVNMQSDKVYEKLKELGLEIR